MSARADGDRTGHFLFKSQYQMHGGLCRQVIRTEIADRASLAVVLVGRQRLRELRVGAPFEGAGLFDARLPESLLD